MGWWLQDGRRSGSGKEALGRSLGWCSRNTGGAAVLGHQNPTVIPNLAIC